MAGDTAYPVALQIEALTLLAVVKVDVNLVSDLLHIPIRTLNRIKAKAAARGFDLDQDCHIKEEYVADGKRSGRPKVIGNDIEQALIEAVTKDRNGREKSLEVLAYDLGISHTTAYKILKRHNFRSTKPTWKPGLSDVAKQRRLEFCLKHQHWTDDDWRNVIWSDETSVVLGHRRGAVRVWRKTSEAHDRTCVRARFVKGADFMFWGSFSYDKKGPCHIWEKETASKKRAAQKELDELNEVIEPHTHEQWKLQQSMSRLNLDGKRRRGRVPTWKFTRKTGRLERNNKSGIDWYRYGKVGD